MVFDLKGYMAGYYSLTVNITEEGTRYPMYSRIYVLTPIHIDLIRTQAPLRSPVYTDVLDRIKTLAYSYYAVTGTKQTRQFVITCENLFSQSLGSLDYSDMTSQWYRELEDYDTEAVWDTRVSTWEHSGSDIPPGISVAHLPKGPTGKPILTEYQKILCTKFWHGSSYPSRDEVHLAGLKIVPLNPLPFPSMDSEDESMEEGWNRDDPWVEYEYDTDDTTNFSQADI